MFVKKKKKKTNKKKKGKRKRMGLTLSEKLILKHEQYKGAYNNVRMV
jgi:cell division protein FtsB